MSSDNSPGSGSNQPPNGQDRYSSAIPEQIKAQASQAKNDQDKRRAKS